MKKAILTCIIILGFMQANAENPPRSYFQFKAEFASVLKPVHGYTETNCPYAWKPGKARPRIRWLKKQIQKQQKHEKRMWNKLQKEAHKLKNIT